MRFYYDKTKKSKDKVKQLWQEIFEDPPAYADFYFEQIYPNNQVLLVEDSDLVAMLHLNPYEVLINDQIYPINYIVGVATDSQYRRQGIMRKMLDKVLLDMAHDKQLFTFLMPAKEAYYTPFQFSFGYDRYLYNAKTAKNKNSNAFFEESLNENNIDELVSFCQSYWLKHFNAAPIRSKEYFFKLQKEVQAEKGQVQLLYEKSELVGFYSYSMSDEKVYLRELITSQDYNSILNYLESNWKKAEIMLDWFNYRDDAKRKPMIMFRILNLAPLLSTIKSNIDQSIVIKVIDPLLKHNDNTFLWKSNPQGSQVTKTLEQPELTISISDLTKILFNYNNMNKGSKNTFFKHIMALDKVFISEIV